MPQRTNVTTNSFYQYQDATTNTDAKSYAEEYYRPSSTRVRMTCRAFPL